MRATQPAHLILYFNALTICRKQHKSQYLSWRKFLLPSLPPALPPALPTFSTKYLPQIFACVVHFLQYAYAQCLGTRQNGRAITNSSTALSSSQPLGERFVQSGEWWVASVQWTFCFCKCSNEYAYRNKSWKLPIRTDSVRNTSTQYSLSAIQPVLCSPHVEFSPFPTAVAMYCLPLPAAQEPYKASLGHDKSALYKSLYIESSDHAPSLFWITGSFVQLVVWCWFHKPEKLGLCTARFYIKNSTASPQTVFMCFLWISG